MGKVLEYTESGNRKLIENIQRALVGYSRDINSTEYERLSMIAGIRQYERKKIACSWKNIFAAGLNPILTDVMVGVVISIMTVLLFIEKISDFLR